MNREFYSYEPAKGHGLKHDPIASILGPRPIGWISSRSLEGWLNLAPYSFFNIFNYKPPIVAFSSVGWKDTLQNVHSTGEFVLNLATRALAEQMNQTSAAAPSDVSEFELSGLTPIPCLRVSAPRVAQTPVAMECRVTQIQQLSSLDGVKLETWMVLGEVVVVHIDTVLLADGIYRTEAAGPILRGGESSDYFEIAPSARFEMQRPR